jgi:hypothetical protein
VIIDSRFRGNDGDGACAITRTCLDGAIAA